MTLGRPRLGRSAKSEAVTVRLTAEQVAMIDRLRHTSRSAWVRGLVAAALAQAGEK